MLDNLVFMDEAWVHLSGYINGQNIRTWSAGNLRALHENPLYSQILVFCVQCINNELRNTCSLKRQLMPKIFQILTLDSLLCSKGMNWINGFSNMWESKYCEKNKSFLAGFLH